LALLPETWDYTRGGAVIYLSLTLQATGRVHEAEALLQNTYPGAMQNGGTFVLRLLLAHSTIMTQEGDLRRAHELASFMLDKAKADSMRLMESWAHYWLGTIHFERGEYALAVQHFEELCAGRLMAHSNAVRIGMVGLALIHAQHDRPTEANEALQLASAYDFTVQGYESNEVLALRAWLAAASGDLTAALNWADSWDEPAPNRALLWLLDPHWIKARLLIQRGRPDDLEKAGNILEDLERTAQAMHNTRYLPQIEVARALQRDAQGDLDGALEALRGAIAHAEPGGIVRPFAEPGRRVRELLVLLTRAEPRDGAAFQLLRKIANTNPRTGAARPWSARQPLADPLTPRELDVLNLMRERRSDKEIASALGISVGTVKRHSANLFAKLNVNRRWEAVVRAEELAIL
jgi:LuxR family maltose regulon positive regulatory protein